MKSRLAALNINSRDMKMTMAFLRRITPTMPMQKRMTANAIGKATGIILLSLPFNGFLTQYNRANGCHKEDDGGDFKGQGVFAVERQGDGLGSRKDFTRGGGGDGN